MRFIQIIVVIIFLVGCVSYQQTSTYNRSQIGRSATVTKGSILSIREVTIEGTESGIGAGAGAVAGGTAGSYAGGNDFRGNVIGAVGGAVAGGIAGSAIEKGATQAKATEFIIRQDNGQTIAVVQSNEENLTKGDRVLILRSDRVRIIRDKTP